MRKFELMIAWFFGFVIGALAMGFGLVILRDSPKPSQLPTSVVVNKKVFYNGSELVIRYNGIGGQPYELVYSANSKRVTLRKKAPGFRPSSEDHDLVKSEVVRLVSARDPISLGDSGLSFYFLEGYPEWGPHEEYCGEGVFAGLFFATGAVVKGNIIEAKGLPAKPTYYYPYPELEVRKLSGDMRDKGNIVAWYAWARMGLSAQYVSLHDMTDLGR